VASLWHLAGTYGRQRWHGQGLFGPNGARIGRPSDWEIWGCRELASDASAAFERTLGLAHVIANFSQGALEDYMPVGAEGSILEAVPEK
jgi:hypothetical protein